LQGGSYVTTSSLLSLKGGSTGQGRMLLAHSDERARSRTPSGATPPDMMSRSRDVRLSNPEMGMIRITDADELDDVDELFEDVNGISLLEQDDLVDSEQAQLQREEQLEAIGAIRAVFKKVVKVADEATAAVASATVQGTQSQAGNIFPPSDSRKNRTARNPPDVTGSQSNVRVAPRRLQKDHALDTPSTPPGRQKETQHVKEDENDDGDSEIIEFIVTSDISFKIPYDLVRTWQVSTIIGCGIP